MPYISQDQRKVLDKEILELVNAIEVANPGNPDQRKGICNYIFTSILNKVFPLNKYHEISEAMAALSDCRDEYYRRRMAPREDQAIEENGDVFNTQEEPKEDTGEWLVTLTDVLMSEDEPSHIFNQAYIFNTSGGEKLTISVDWDKLHATDTSYKSLIPKIGHEGLLTSKDCEHYTFRVVL